MVIITAITAMAVITAMTTMALMAAPLVTFVGTL